MWYVWFLVVACVPSAHRQLTTFLQATEQVALSRPSGAAQEEVLAQAMQSLQRQMPPHARWRQHVEYVLRRFAAKEIMYPHGFTDAVMRRRAKADERYTAAVHIAAAAAAAGYPREEPARVEHPKDVPLPIPEATRRPSEEESKAPPSASPSALPCTLPRALPRLPVHDFIVNDLPPPPPRKRGKRGKRGKWYSWVPNDARETPRVWKGRGRRWAVITMRDRMLSFTLLILPPDWDRRTGSFPSHAQLIDVDTDVLTRCLPLDKYLFAERVDDATGEPHMVAIDESVIIGVVELMQTTVEFADGNLAYWKMDKAAARGAWESIRAHWPTWVDAFQTCIVHPMSFDEAQTRLRLAGHKDEVLMRKH